jgi:hypothetical protein
VRDSRVAMIYEGTNEVQAIDLLRRKVLDNGAARLNSMLARLEADATAAPAAAAEFAQALRAQVDAARAATAALLDGRAADPEWPLRVADDYLRGIGLTLLAWAWMRSAQAALRHAATPGTTTSCAVRASACSGCCPRRRGAGSACWHGMLRCRRWVEVRVTAFVSSRVRRRIRVRAYRQNMRGHTARRCWEGRKAGRDVGYCHLEKPHNLESLPGDGYFVSCFPHKIRGASAGWARAAERLTNDDLMLEEDVARVVEAAVVDPRVRALPQ